MPGLPYPNSPGAKEIGGTSEEAAEAISGRAPVLADRVLITLKQQGPRTADEVAAWLGETPFAIRPRFSELCRKGLIAPTDHRRKNASGMSARVWEAR